MTEKKLKYITLISILIFLVLMLPVIYLTFVNRATGDDYGYGTYTRTAWMGTHSLIEVGKALCSTVKSYYYAWQGTWFSIALFSLQPEVFHDDAYVIVAVLMLFLWIGSTFCLFRQILCRNMGLNKWSYLLITVWFLIISIEFIPSPRPSIFWFNGCAHYMIPFAMCQMVTAWLLKYSAGYKKSTFVGIIIFMTLLGGSNYQAALFVLIVALYVIVSSWYLKKDKRIFTLCAPVLAEMAGLAVSAMAPGNKSRAGEEFGFSVGKALGTIGKSFLYGIKDIGTYANERPLVFVGLLFLFLVFIAVFSLWEDAYRFEHPILLSAMFFCLYSAMQAPAIYADVSVSGGVPNTNYQVFLLTASGILFIVASKLNEKMKKVGKGSWSIIVYGGVLLCVILTFYGRSYIKISTSYVSLIYTTSGQAKDYKEQMDLQTRLMEDESTEDVVIPCINDVQGPLMHMPVTDNVKAWTNTVTAAFYGKHSVVSMERPAWMEIYGD